MSEQYATFLAFKPASQATLREWYSILALGGILASEGAADDAELFSDQASLAVKMADALVAELAKVKQGSNGT